MGEHRITEDILKSALKNKLKLANEEKIYIVKYEIGEGSKKGNG